MSTLVLIMAQGEQRRLAKLGKPKQLLEVAGETLFARQVRQARSHGADEVIAIAREDFDEAVTTAQVKRVMFPDPGVCILDGIAKTQLMWMGYDRVVVLLGDVVFSRAAAEIVMSDSRPLVFFGTSNLGTALGEVFAMSVSVDGVPELKDLLAKAPCRRTQRLHTAAPGHLRRLVWAAMFARSLKADRVQVTWSSQLYRPIDDYTDDIDTPTDVSRLRQLEQSVRADQS